jgi:DNA-binding NarL/FixJ family response regulator
MPKSIRIVIVHPNRLFRESLTFAVDQQPNMQTAGAVADVGELWPNLAALDAQVFILDLGLPGRDGLRQTRELSQACPMAAILVTGVSELESDVVSCCEAGATGYLTRDCSLSDLIDHLRAAAAGETPCSPKVAALLFSRLRDRARDVRRLEVMGPIRLTRRELEIIGLIERRLSNKEIAIELHIEVQTVKNHVHNILEKLELDGRYDVVQYARERGLLPYVAEPPRPGVKVGATAS